MKIVSILNLKGGVGKSITTINLAHELAAACHQRVLVVDADPQNDTSQFYGHGDEDGLLRLLHGDCDSTKELIVPTSDAGVSLIPASYDVYSIDISAHVRGYSGFMDSFHVLAADCETLDLADIILVDCPPGFNSSCCAALSASTDVIVPMATDAFSVKDMAALVRYLASLKKVNPKLHLDGVLITMWHNAEVVTLAEAALHQAGYPMFKTHIRRTDRVPESTWAAQPLEIFSKRCAAAADYKAFAAEVWEMWGCDR